MLERIKTFINELLPRNSRSWRSLHAGYMFVWRCYVLVNWIKVRLLLWTVPFKRIGNINHFDAKAFSQNGEDGILLAIFKKIGTTNRFCIEFGVENGSERNTRYLCEKRGWNCLLMDPADTNPPTIKREFVTAENINGLFRKYGVPNEFDLLSIDIDGSDYWVWKALGPEYSARVVVVEYNAKIPPHESKAVVYDPAFRWDGSDYFGASLRAFVELAQAKGYTLVGCDRKGVNAFFVRNDCLGGAFVPRTLVDAYRPPRYGKSSDQGGHPASARRMIPV
jgi:hypothetical protein